MKRHCEKCGCNTKQTPATTTDEKKVWVCGCCGSETPRITRTSKKQRELNELFNRLTK